MGLGSTAKKVQKLADVAEKTYKRLNELRQQVQEVRTTVDETGDRVETLEKEAAEQRAILDAVAREHDLDPEAITADGESDDGKSTEADDGPAGPDEAAASTEN